jgi:hypothetical protein
MMKFRRTYSIIISTLTYLVVIACFFLFDIRKGFILEITISYLLFEAFIASTFITHINHSIIMYRFFIRRREIKLSEIKRIEAVTVKKFGYIHIVVGDSLSEDYYYLVLQDNSKIEIDRHYTNKGKALGRYLHEEYKIKLIETEKIRYFNT